MLLNLKHAKEKAIAKGKAALHRNTLKRYSDLYDKIIQLAYEENPIPERKPGKKGRTKLGKVLCLIDRLFCHKGEVCLFAYDFDVPIITRYQHKQMPILRCKKMQKSSYRIR